MDDGKASYHHGDLRNALISEAVTLVEAGGAERFSLREAARLVGVSAKAAYRHFADKSDLIAAIADYGYGLLEQSVLEAVVCAPEHRIIPEAAIARLRAAGRAYIAFAVEHPELLRIMFASESAPLPDDNGLVVTAPYALLGKVLDDLVDAGVLPVERRPGAELKAWVAVHGFATIVLQARELKQRQATSEKALETILDFALDGLCGRKIA